MRIFVTGASGFVGSAVMQELLAAGHSVLGLARSEQGAATVAALGADVHRGSLEDVASLASGAAACDAVIHTGFNHDFSKFVANCALDRRAIEALGAALKGSTRPLLVTSGLAQLAQGRLATEADLPNMGAGAHPRVSEATALALVKQGVHAAVVRLPPSVHGAGDHGFVTMLINFAREKGVSAYMGDGDNLWPAVHRLDAARVFRLATERGAAGGPYHAVAEVGIPFREIAALIARRLDVPLVSKSPEEAAAHFGWFAPFAAMDVPASSGATRTLLDWQPSHAGLLHDMETAGYF